MTVSPTVFSSVIRTAPLGLRLADATDGAPLAGWRAWAWRADLDLLRQRSPVRAVARERELVREATAAPSGALTWHDLPGFARWSIGPVAPEVDPWDPALQRAYTVLAVDPSGHALPVRLTVPVPVRGLVRYDWAAADTRDAVRAWSSPDRPIREGYATIRATLWDHGRDCPAAWAVLTCAAGGARAHGLAGDDGRVVVHLPWPRPRITTPATPLSAQSWALSASVRYGQLTDPRVVIDAVGTLPGRGYRPGVALRGDLPLAPDIDAQPAATLVNTPGVPFVSPALRFGAELSLTSPGAGSRLLVVV